MIKNNTLKLNKIFTFIVLLFPFLSIYKSGISLLTIGDILLIFLFIYLLFHDYKKSIKIYLSFFLLVLYFIISLVVQYFFIQDFEFVNSFGSVLRYCFYLIFLCLFAKEHFDLRYGAKIVILLSLIATIAILVQYLVAKMFNYYIKLYIPFFELSNQEIYDFDLGGNVTMDNFRPRSFFNEPAHFSQYVIIGLIANLFYQNKKMNKIICTILFTIGIFVSGANTGILALPVVFLLYIISSYSKNDIMNLLKTISVILLIGLIMILIIKDAPFFENFINRITSNGENSAFNNRFNGYEYAFDFINYSNVEFFIGHGFKTSGKIVYMAGFARVMYEYGIIGILFFSSIFAVFFIKTNNKFIKSMIVLTIFLSIGTEIINGPFIILYFPFLLDNFKKGDI